MVATAQLTYEPKQVCGHDYSEKECREVSQQKKEYNEQTSRGDSGSQKIICDRMWPETCYVCDDNESVDGTRGRCREVEKDPCKRNPIDPKHDILPKECYEKAKLQAPKEKLDGIPEKSPKEEEKSGSSAPAKDSAAWKGVFDRFTADYAEYMEKGNAVAMRDKDEDDDDDTTDKPDKSDKPDKPEKSDWREKAQKDYKEKAAQAEKTVRDYPYHERAEQLRSESKQAHTETDKDAKQFVRDVGNGNFGDAYYDAEGAREHSKERLDKEKAAAEMDAAGNRVDKAKKK